MMKPASHASLFAPLIVLLLAVCTYTVAARDATGHDAFIGSWRLNEKLSDDTDRQVEVAIREGGGRIDSGGRRGKGRYKGGPAEHALYDHISYDETLEFRHTAPEFRLLYAEGFERVFYSDDRTRVVSASGTSSFDRQDYSFASWDGERLLVESRPRDGGWINETFELLPETGQLRITLQLKPSSFAEPINIIRIYDRVTDDATPPAAE